MPHTICIEAYEYDELSEQAKEKALFDIAERFDYWGDDHRAVLESFEKIFPVTIREWEYGGNYPHVSFTLEVDSDLYYMSGIRLLAHLWNNYKNDLYKGKYYSKYVDGKYISRHSKIILDDCCPNTGYYTEDATLAPIHEFMNKPCEYTSFYDLMNECLQAWAYAGEQEYQDWYSEENMADMATANSVTFTEDGKII